MSSREAFRRGSSLRPEAKTFKACPAFACTEEVGGRAERINPKLKSKPSTRTDERAL